MSGRDHETDIDGNCMKECKECYIEKLELNARDFKRELERIFIVISFIKDNLEDSQGLYVETIETLKDIKEQIEEELNG